MEFETFKSSTGEKRYPIVYRKTSSDAIQCPYCGEEHNHGTGDGHRIAHCSTNRRKEQVDCGGVMVDSSNGYHIATGFWLNGSPYQPGKSPGVERS